MSSKFVTLTKRIELESILRQFAPGPLAGGSSKDLGISEEEIDYRLRVTYRGTCPKKRVDGNVNYLDHNVLALSNRRVVPGQRGLRNHGDPLQDSVDTISREKSQVNGDLSNLIIGLQEKKHPAAKGDRKASHNYIHK